MNADSIYISHLSGQHISKLMRGSGHTNWLTAVASEFRESFRFNLLENAVINEELELL